jgi:hypothetical protein
MPGAGQAARPHAVGCRRNGPRLRAAGASPDPSPVAPPSPAPRKGRPPSKRSNPAFEQVTAYIPGELYRKVRIGLLEDAKGQEFSELVADLLSAWLAGRKPG